MALQPSAPKPISFAPSQAFEGNDGPWSTFAIRLGTPEQVFHVLMSTASEETWIPVPEGCLPTDPGNCGSLRGALSFNNVASNGFQVNAQGLNLYALGLDSDLNYTGNGEYGFDTVGTQVPNSGGITLSHQIVAGIATKDFYLGMFPLGPKPTNFTNFNSPQPSYLWSLKNQSYIPSLSWGYTAGNQYRLKEIPGSLTLGGYDASRFTSNNMTFTFDENDSKPLTLGLHSITATNTFQGVVSLLPSAILTFIDSTIPEIWLPTSACAIFETAFRLQYDEHTDRYLVNETIHANLTAMNPVLTFRLDNEADNTGTGESITISLPYKAFDLQAEYPIYNKTTNYFPLRRANDESQYRLGRTFLQEAYVIADYERQNFSVSQCVFEDNNPQQIVAIEPLSTQTAAKSRLSTGTKVGIGVGVAMFVILVAICAFVIFRRRKKQRHAREEMEAETALAEVGKIHIPEKVEVGTEGELAEAEVRKYRTAEVLATVPEELAASAISAEMEGLDMRHELVGKDIMFELPGSPGVESRKIPFESPLKGKLL